MDTQAQSRLFSLPVELRQAIYDHIIPYAVHLFQQDKNVTISACIEPYPDRHLSGRERYFAGDWRTDATMARRLRSSWGPHWNCEEVARRTGVGHDDETTLTAILATCKKMYTDILVFMSSTVTFNVTDLETLKWLVQRDQDSGLSHLLLAEVCPSSLRQLSITLRLPRSFFKTLENDVASLTEGSSGSGEDILEETPHDEAPSQQLKMWTRVWAALAYQLKQLQSLQIWLDNDDKSSWSMVNERAILSHLAASISIGSIPGLEHVSVNLPLLNPRHETPERHFMKDGPSPPACFTVQRSLRPTLQVEEITSGQFHVTDDSELAFLVDFFELQSNGSEDGGLAGFVDWVREAWEKGQDVEAEFEAIINDFPICKKILSI
ncbi:hypothetical protein DL770_003817 [Monosporascus sp. CRB-9-2]|nr:hypothetical protein DL770_003817 [Monosporascus sp. CRB-9-2]